jgi:hypothetical protein
MAWHAGTEKSIIKLRNAFGGMSPRKALYLTTAALCALTVAIPVASALAEAPTATITGTVFHDRDTDGLQDIDEPGIGGVSVSDGQKIVVTDVSGRYALSISTDRRNNDIVFITQPAGYSVGTDQFMTPRFYRDLGALTDGDAKEVNFGLREDKDSRANKSHFTFGNVADPHVNAQLPQQIQEINSTRQSLAFIQVSGDLTNNATDAEFITYKTATALSKVPVWPAVGNHEYAAGNTYAARINNYRRHVGPEWYSFDYGDRHFLVLEDNGAAPFEEQLDWVKADLALNVKDGKHLVVLTHQPMKRALRFAGKVIDMAVTDQPDQLDWINLPYVSTAEPVGGSAWQQLQTRASDVQIVENTGTKAVVGVTGTSVEHPGLTIITTYTAYADDQFITAATEFINTTAGAMQIWAGDALDHDGTGSRSAVSGNPVITSGGPFSQVPDVHRWIGQAGTGPDNQTYGLIYSVESGPFTGYSQGNFTMSKFQLTIPANGSHPITRKIVVASNGAAADKFAVLNDIVTR